MWQKQQPMIEAETDKNGNSPDNGADNAAAEMTDKEKGDRDVEKQLEKTESQNSLGDFEYEREKQLATKCLKLMMQGRQTAASVSKVMCQGHQTAAIACIQGNVSRS